ncbi:uncharacterized protein VTP21DRAFT_5975 [Calcarisporiella thermophila]|uniref:uncharacterized protein n=1 Tax=Calcarisporiella thermophila TaxID=911321 RepID=UPI0037431B5D
MNHPYETRSNCQQRPEMRDSHSNVYALASSMQTPPSAELSNQEVISRMSTIERDLLDLWALILRLAVSQYGHGIFTPASYSIFSVAHESRLPTGLSGTTRPESPGLPQILSTRR